VIVDGYAFSGSGAGPYCGDSLCLSWDSKNLNNATLLITFVFTNGNSFDSDASLIVTSDADFNGADSAPMMALPAWSGFALGPVSGLQFNYVFRNSDLVTDMDTFWVGSLGQLGTGDLQLTSHQVSGDASLAFSWQNRIVPANGALNLSFLVKSQSSPIVQPNLSIDLPTLSPIASPDHMFHISGSVFDDDSSKSLRVVLVVGDHPDSVYSLVMDLHSGEDFTSTFSMSALSSHDGRSIRYRCC
jgi:hypothetical protein